MKIENLNVFSDSMLVVYQVNGGFQARGPRTEMYMRCSQRLLKMFKEAKLEQLPRGNNLEADALAKNASQRDTSLLGVIPLGIQKQPSVPEAELMIIEAIEVPTWITPILDYLREGTLPEDRAEARKLKYRAARYVNYEGALYKRGFN